MATWYVVPSGSNGDGSQASPWVGFSNIVWGSIQPGDTLIVDGVFRETMTIGASGEANYPVRVNFAPTGLIWPSALISSWTKVVGYEVWYATVEGSYRYQLWQDGLLLTPDDHDNTTPTRDTAAAAMETGTWRMRGSTEIMVRCTDDGDPNSKVMYGTDRGNDGKYGAIDVRGRNHIQVIAPKIRGANWNAGMPAGIVTEGDGIAIHGGAVIESGRILRAYGGAGLALRGLLGDNLINVGVSLSAVTSADTSVENPLSNVLIQHCRIARVARVGRYNGIDWTFNSDADAIGIGYEGGSISNVRILDNAFERIGPQYVDDSDVPAHYTSNSVNRGASIYIGSGEIVPFSCEDVVIERNFHKYGHRWFAHIGPEASGQIRITANTVAVSGEHAAGTSILRVASTEGEAANVITANNSFVDNTNRSVVALSNLTSKMSVRNLNNVMQSNDAVDHASALTWYGDFWRIGGAYAPSVDVEDYNAHGPRDGLSSADLARESSDTAYTTLAAYYAATGRGEHSIQADLKLRDDHRLESDSPCLAAGINWWDALDEPPPTGQDGLRFCDPPSMGAYEVRPGKSGYARRLGAMPLRTLPLGADSIKARSW